MYLKKLQVENYRLLKDVSISLDKNLTLFVGKNNTGKTSLMEVIKFLISNASSLPFDDYPLDCRQELYTAIVNYWNDTSENPVIAFQRDVPITKVTMTIDYSDGNLGNVSAFVIDLEEEYRGQTPLTAARSARKASITKHLRLSKAVTGNTTCSMAWRPPLLSRGSFTRSTATACRWRASSRTGKTYMDSI